MAIYSSLVYEQNNSAGKYKTEIRNKYNVILVYNIVDIFSVSVEAEQATG